MTRSSLLTAAITTAAVWLALFLLIHFKHGDDWTAIYYTGAYTQTPPTLADEQIYRFPTAGFDGQFYHFIAHDPWISPDTARFVDNPRLRWRRILVPALAWLGALGQSDFVDSAYAGVMLTFVFLGVYWLSRLVRATDVARPVQAAEPGVIPAFSREPLPALRPRRAVGRTLARFGSRSAPDVHVRLQKRNTRSPAAAWGATFLLIPAVLISLERGTVDVALAALCVAFALYGTEQSALIYPALVLAPLARETGLCLTSAFVALQLRQRQYGAATLAALTATPFLAWTLYLNAQTAADHTAFASPIPLKGLLIRTLHPLQYAVTSNWLRKAAALDYLAVAGIWIALVFVAIHCRKLSDPLCAAALAFSLVAIFLAQPQAWAEAYAFARTMSPLLIFAALLAVRDRRWWGLAPLAATLPRVLFQLWTAVKSA